MLTTKIYDNIIEGNELKMGQIIGLHMKLAQIVEQIKPVEERRERLMDVLTHFRDNTNLTFVELMDVTITIRTKYSSILDEGRTSIIMAIMQMHEEAGADEAP